MGPISPSLLLHSARQGSNQIMHALQSLKSCAPVCHCYQGKLRMSDQGSWAAFCQQWGAMGGLGVGGGAGNPEPKAEKNLADPSFSSVKINKYL